MVKAASWIPVELKKLYGNDFKGSWVDLNGDGKQQANEEIRTYNANNILGLKPTEKNPYKKKIGDWTDWLAFYRKNRKLIDQKVGKNKNSIFHWAAKFKKTNFIHIITSIESPLVSRKVVLNAYKKITKILSRSARLYSDTLVKIHKFMTRSKNKRAVFEKLMAKLLVRRIYEAIRKEGVVIKDQEKPLLTENLNRNRLDCDTSSFIVLTEAGEHNWPLYLVHMPIHALLRWDNGMTGSDRVRINLDYGLEMPDSHYLAQVDPQTIKSGLYFTNIKSRRRLISSLIANRALALNDKKKYKRSIAECDLALLLNPKNEAALNNRGWAKAKLGQHSAAIEDFNRAIALDPRSASAYLNRANARFQVGKYREAINDYKQALKYVPKRGIMTPRGFIPVRYDPIKADIYNDRAGTYFRLGYYNKAANDLAHAMKLDPKRYKGQVLPKALFRLNPKLSLQVHPRYRFVNGNAVDVRTALGASLDIYRYDWFRLGAMLDAGYGAGKQSHTLDLLGGISLSARYVRSIFTLETAVGYNFHLAGEEEGAPIGKAGVFRYGLKYTHNFKQVGLSASVYLQHEIPSSDRFAIMFGLGVDWNILETYVGVK
jgi:tetratricopeptide (TPR) repeat protein